MNQDHYFYIGKSHDVCEDFAASGQYKEYNYAIVSDGCSGSTNTDIGSRILTRAAISNIDKIYDENLFKNLVVQKASTQINLLDLNQNSLDATLLVAACKDGLMHLHIYGDGCGVVKYKSGDIIIHDTEFPDNAPYYLNYLTDTLRNYNFKSNLLNNKEFKYTDYISMLNDDVTGRVADAPSAPEYFWKSFSYCVSDIEYIAVMTDGVKSFEKKIIDSSSISKEPIDYLDVIKEMCSFKNTKGSFVKRRVKSALNNYIKNNTTHLDDFSMAVLYNEK